MIRQNRSCGGASANRTSKMGKSVEWGKGDDGSEKSILAGATGNNGVTLGVNGIKVEYELAGERV